MKSFSRLMMLAGIAALAGGWWAVADDREQLQTRDEVRIDKTEATATEPISEELPASMARVSDLDGMAIYGADGEKLGDIKDVVIDLHNGTVSYAVLSFGGFLGVGDKLFAVPWQAMQFTQHENDTRLVLAVEKDRLENAPGFDNDHWPNFADANWTRDINRYYGIEERQTGFRPENGTEHRKHQRNQSGDTGIEGIDETRDSDGADVRIEAGEDGADVDVDTKDNR